jgi:allantoin racemase
MRKRGGIQAMRIKAIMASSSKELARGQLQSRQAALGPNTEVELVAPPHCPPATENEHDRLVAALAVFSEAANAREEGFDAVTIDCTLDPGLKAARKTVRIPVVGAGEAALAVSLILGERFSVIMPVSESRAPMIAKIREMGLSGRLASVRSADLPVLDLHDDDRTLDAVERVARRAVLEDDADVIVLGCTAMGRIASPLAERVGVPVIEPATAALKLAEAFAAPGWWPVLAPKAGSCE